MKKIVTLFLTLFFVFTLCITNVKAEELIGTVKDITKPDSLKDGTGTLDPPNGKAKEVTLTFSSATLAILPSADAGTTGTSERPGGYAWVGISVTAPDGASATYKVNSEEYQKSESPTFEKYVGISVDNLKKHALAGDNLVYTYNIDWNNDDTIDQTVKIIIKPEGIVLKESETSDKQLWNNDIMQDVIDDAKQPENPNTGDINMPILLSMIVVGSLGIICMKKRRWI